MVVPCLEERMGGGALIGKGAKGRYHSHGSTPSAETLSCPFPGDTFQTITADERIHHSYNLVYSTTCAGHTGLPCMAPGRHQQGSPSCAGSSPRDL
jgi:hypothetical protein